MVFNKKEAEANIKNAYGAVLPKVVQPKKEMKPEPEPKPFARVKSKRPWFIEGNAGD